MKNTTIVKDPVCGMDVETGSAAAQSEHAGKTYSFCSSKCKDKFDRDPQQFMGQASGTPKNDHDCCG